MNDEQAAGGALPAIGEISERQRWRTFLLCFLGWLFDHYDLMLFAFISRSIGKDWQWGDAFTANKALLIGVALFTSGLGGGVFGGLADRLGRRRVLGWTIL